MSKGKTTVFTWPWIITAWLFPVVFAEVIILVVVSSARARQEQEVTSSIDKATRLNDPVKQLNDSYFGSPNGLVTMSGYDKVDAPPVAEFNAPEGSLEPIQVPGGELTPIQKKWAAFASSVRNGGEYSVAGLRRHQKRMAQWSAVVDSNRIYKLNNHLLSAAAAASQGRVEEALEFFGRAKSAGAVSESKEGDLEASAKIAKDAGNDWRPVDPFAPKDATLVEIAEAQRTLLQAFSAWAAEVAASGKSLANGHRVLESATTVVESDKKTRDTGIAERGAAVRAVGEQISKQAVASAEEQRALATSLAALNSDPEPLKGGNVLRDQQDMANFYDTQRVNSKDDKDEFTQELQAHKMKGLGRQSLLTSINRADGHVSQVNRLNGTCILDLGSGDNIQPGMRFEIWQHSGKDKDYFKAMVEVIRTVAPSFSLCTILATENADDPVRDGDAAVNILWNNGRYVSVALAGKLWTPELTRFPRERLKVILENMGVTVSDAVKPSTELVILGGSKSDGYGKDEANVDALDNVRTDTVFEERVRLYVMPR